MFYDNNSIITIQNIFLNVVAEIINLISTKRGIRHFFLIPVPYIRNNVYICTVHAHAFGLMGRDNDILESVIDALFLVCLNYHNQISNQDNAEVNATGVVYIPGVCRGLIMPSRTLLGVLYTYWLGIQTLFVLLERAVVGLNTRKGR